MRAILDVILLILQLYIYVLFGAVIMSWLLAFNIVNYNNNIVRTIWNALTGLTEPVLGPIRRRMPNLGAIDLSPIVLLLIIFFIERVIVYYIYPAVR